MDELSFRKQVNASGFPFQIRVAHEVRTTYDTHKWIPVPGEHRWVNDLSGAEGFIDLILSKTAQPGLTWWYIVIECKRVRGGSWVFLNTRSDQKAYDAHVLLTCRQHESVPPKWIKADLTPASPVSFFCTVPGQADKDTPMLERVAGELLDSLESLAQEQLSVGPEPSPDYPERRAVYIPVIVTNTELVVCYFEPTEVSLSEGILQNGSGNFDTVPFIRFQKSLSTRFTTGKIPMNLKEVNKEDERTVFIVHALSLPDFLGSFGFL